MSTGYTFGVEICCRLSILWVDDVRCSVPPTAEARVRESAFMQGMKHKYSHGLKVSADDQAFFYCIGLVCERSGPRTWRIHQRLYLEQVLEKAGFVVCKPDDVPITLRCA